MELTAAIDQSSNDMFFGRDIPWLLDQWAERTPDACFLTWAPFTGEDKHWTYAELRRDARRFAGSLAERGVKPGDKVLIHLDNSPEIIISWFGCAYLGAAAVTTNTRSVKRDMEYFAEHAEVVCAITQPAFAQLVYESAPSVLFLAVTDHNSGEPSAVDGDFSYLPFDDLLSDNAECPDRPRDPTNDLAIQFTSGTTSRPKAVLWTHGNNK